MYFGLPVKYPSTLSDFIEILIFSTGFRKIDIKFHENPSSGIRVPPRGPTDMTNLTVAFHNFAKAPKQSRPVNIGYPLP